MESFELCGTKEEPLHDPKITKLGGERHLSVIGVMGFCSKYCGDLFIERKARREKSQGRKNNVGCLFVGCLSQDQIHAKKRTLYRGKANNG